MTQLRSLASYLVNFDAIHADDESASLNPDGVADIESEPEIFAKIPSLETREAVAREEIRVAAEAHYFARLEQEIAHFNEQLAVERRVWIENEGTRLAEQFGHAYTACSTELREVVGRVLRPFVSRSILERSLSDFVDAIRNAASAAETPLVQLRGPSDLIEIIGQRLDSERISFTSTIADAVEVEAKIRNTTIETQLGEWIKQLRNEE